MYPIKSPLPKDISSEHVGIDPHKFPLSIEHDARARATIAKDYSGNPASALPVDSRNRPLSFFADMKLEITYIPRRHFHRYPGAL
ncbi:hypothetical protein GCM10027066_35080 [Dyella jejuensis]